jgi:MYXO-CTERM domain-containing protein
MLAVAGGGVFAIVVLGAVWLWRRRKEGNLRSVLKAIAISSQTDVTLPDTNQGKIHLEHLIFTAKGLLVLDVKNISGVVFGSDAIEEWTTIDNARRFTFRNPQPGGGLRRLSGYGRFQQRAAIARYPARRAR